MKRALSVALITTTAQLLLAVPAAADIGTVSAVNTDMEGTPPGGTRRALLLGNQVVSEERVQTSAVGSGQLLFLDQTTLTVAPNSNIVLDEYVYDPDQQTGDIAITVGRGALRFVGGKISKSRDAKVVTPTATIGIRGGLVLIIVEDDGSTRVIFTAGEYVVIVDKNGQRVVLSRPNAMAEILPTGQARFIGLATAQDYQRYYALLEGSGSGGSGVGPGIGANGTEIIAIVNSGVEGGEKNAPVSTSGEQPADEPEEQTTRGSLSRDPRLSNLGGGLAPPSEGTTSSPPPGNPTPTTLGGAVFLPTIGVQPFTSVARSSLIGTTASGEVTTIPVPATSADFVTTFSVGPAPKYFATSIAPNSGFFEFGQTPDTQGTTTSLGPLTGFGFSDLDDDFHFYQITAPETGEIGIVAFGNDTTTQQSFLTADNGSLPTTANTASTFILEPDFEQSLGTGLPLLVIANGGEARFPHTSHTLDANGGKVLAAEAAIVSDPQLGQFSTFSVAAPRLFQNGSGGLRFGGVAFITSVDGNGTFSISEDPIGTFEDRDGNTVFGGTNEYLVVSSLRRTQDSPGSLGEFDTQNLGTERDLGGTDAPGDPFATVATLDPQGDLIIADPFPRALAPASAVGAANSLGTTPVDPTFIGYSAGIAQCSSGTCGTSLSSTGDTGFIGLTGFAFVSFLSGAFGPDSNSLLFTIDLNSPDRSGLAAGNTDGSNWAFFGFPTVDEQPAFLSDSLFGGTSSGPGVANGADVQNVRLAFATQELASDGGLAFPTGTNSTPNYVSWGWWSATYPGTDVTGVEREDGIHLGTFVVGAPPDPSLLTPNLGQVSYQGFAVGTTASLLAGTSEIVSGSFNMTYDFATTQGTFGIDIAGQSFANVPFQGDPNDLHNYQVNQVGIRGVGANLEASGGFFAGGQDPVAATGGNFRIEQPGSEQLTTGVFGGDRLP